VNREAIDPLSAINRRRDRGSEERSTQCHPDKEETAMSKLRKILQSMERSFTAVARARVQSTLLTMGPEWAEKYGYSWEALRQGIDAWPWRRSGEAKVEEKEIRRAICELNRLSDRELRELGLARSGIESAVRFGHPDRDFTFTLDRRDVAA
jgi:hypothetical protein